MKISHGIAGLLFALSTTAAYAGFYAGAGAGVRPLSANFTKMKVAGVKIDNLDESVTKPAVDLFAGYGHTFNNGLYLAGEAFYEYMNMSTAVGATVQAFGQSINERISAELDYNLGISAILGYRTHSSDLFYGRFGVMFDELYYKASSQVLGTTSDSTKGQHYAGALQFGLGFQHPLTKHISIRGEYTYSRYPNESVNIDAHIPIVGETSVVSFTPKVSINAATVGLIYTF